jgi:hypothetical protein
MRGRSVGPGGGVDGAMELMRPERCGLVSAGAAEEELPGIRDRSAEGETGALTWAPSGATKRGRSRSARRTIAVREEERSEGVRRMALIVQGYSTGTTG